MTEQSVPKGLQSHIGVDNVPFEEVMNLRYEKLLTSDAFVVLNDLANLTHFNQQDGPHPKEFWDQVEANFKPLDLKGNFTFERLNEIDGTNLKVEWTKNGVPQQPGHLSFARVISHVTRYRPVNPKIAIDFRVSYPDPGRKVPRTVPLRIQIKDMDIFMFPQGFSRYQAIRSGFFADLRDVGILGGREKAGLVLPSNYDPKIDSEDDLRYMQMVVTPRFGIENLRYNSRVTDLYPFPRSYTRGMREYAPFIKNNAQQLQEISNIPKATLF